MCTLPRNGLVIDSLVGSEEYRYISDAVTIVPCDQFYLRLIAGMINKEGRSMILRLIATDVTHKFLYIERNSKSLYGCKLVHKHVF